MGQYGALGYAVKHSWNYEQILGHYYSNTTASNVGNPEMPVELTALTGGKLVAIGTNLRVNGVAVGSGSVAIRADLQSNGSVLLKTGPNCGGPFVPLAGSYTAGAGGAESLSITTTDQSTVNNLIRVCEADGERVYRGRLTVQNVGGTQMTFNRLPTEAYLRGVVPRESPDGWGSLGAGKGMEALKAQAVAARSYALSSTRASGARICDTTACQVYGGAAWRAPSGATTVLEGTNANTAINATAGWVRRMASTTAIARTEFSSSTGGYTAGGTFPAVADAGDAISSNPNHNWTTVMSTATVASKLGAAGIRSLTVTGRNGLGADGGRVTQVTLVDSGGATRTFTGNEMRSALGLKSDWFTIEWVSRAEAENVVRALYQDVLGRGVDPSGLQTWTDYVVRTGSPRDLAERIATSRERMNKLVAGQYRAALLREPEPAGQANWVAHLEAGSGVYDLQIGIYGSPESLQKLGGGDVGTWVGAMYEAILGRTAAASERAHWAGVAAAQGRAAVVAGIARSEEATMRRLTVYYQTFLLRGVDPSGKVTFLPLMTGRGDFTIPVALGGSPEYWARAQTRDL